MELIIEWFTNSNLVVSIVLVVIYLMLGVCFLSLLVQITILTGIFEKIAIKIYEHNEKKGSKD